MAIDKFDFKQWLQAKDPNAHYHYVNNNCCAFAQYLEAKGYKEVYVDPYSYSYIDNGVHKSYPMSEPFDRALGRGDTFGGLLKQLDILGVV
jgi:hypothetical protein